MLVSVFGALVGYIASCTHSKYFPFDQLRCAAARTVPQSLGAGAEDCELDVARTGSRNGFAFLLSIIMIFIFMHAAAR